jgi:hypothetical protein
MCGRGKEYGSLTAFRSPLPERFKAAHFAGREDRYVAANVLFLYSRSPFKKAVLSIYPWLHVELAQRPTSI